VSIISLHNITKKFDNRVILDDISIEFVEGKITALQGLSGSGKSTLLRLISGLEIVDRGDIYLYDKLATRDREILIPPSQREIGFIFQDLALWSHMSIYQNIAFGLKIKRSRDIENQVMQMLDYFGISSYRDSYPDKLSGGQQQLVAIARSLVLQPRILLMDEPLSNLDSGLKEKMLLLIRELRDKFDVTILYVTHDHNEAYELADEIITIKDGKI